MNTVATAYPETFETWSELIGLSPVVIRYNVKLHKGFSLICTEIAVRLNGQAAANDREPIKTLGIDIETYSSEDISSCGVYRYAEADDFTVLLFAYSVNDGPVRIVDLASGEKLPERIFDALTDETVLKPHLTHPSNVRVSGGITVSILSQNSGSALWCGAPCSDCH